MEAIVIDSGRLNFLVKTSDGEQPWTPDCMELKLACEELESKHQLKEVNGQMAASGPFLLDLADAFKRLGCPACDSTQALRVWVFVTAKAMEIIHGINSQLG